MRTIIEIPENQLKDLSHICTSQNISRAEAIRRAITIYVSEELNQEDSAFGIWKSRKINSLNYQNNLRKEWK